MKIRYNAPVVLTFTLLSTLVLILQQYTPLDVMQFFWVEPRFDLANPLWYFRLFSHVVGHGSPNPETGHWEGWQHLVGNFSFILLLGPILEEKYGSKDLLLMVLVTALITGLLQIIFFNSILLGASGIVFMFILLSSITNSKGGIPLTFVLVAVLFLGKEIVQSFAVDQVSQFAHIIGGILGAAFGFFMEGGAKKVANMS
ncbi:MAG: rhomboid family intramembrane serine protease [Bacteroidetes bacterium]|nr:MAG: rhomboid family intramembrane serine protease [Bacteroidota bacterium]